MSDAEHDLLLYSESARNAREFAGECRRLGTAAKSAGASVNTAVTTLDATLTSEATRALGVRITGTAEQLEDIRSTLVNWKTAADAFANEIERLCSQARTYTLDIKQAQRALINLEDQTGQTPEEAVSIALHRRILEQSIEGDSRALSSFLSAMERQEEIFAQQLEAGQVRIGVIPPFAVCSFGTRVQSVDLLTLRSPFGDADYLWVLYVMGLTRGDPVAYDLVDAPLFKTDEDGNIIISASDVAQGRYGDCWFIAALMAVAAQRPDLIEDMIRYDENTGNYTVRFYGKNGKREEVVVDGRLILNKDGEPVGAGWGIDRVLWPSIIEKGLVEYWGGEITSIENDRPALGIRLITGEDNIHVDFHGAVDWAVMDEQITVSELADVIHNPDSPGIVLALTRGGSDKSVISTGLAGSHVYYVEDVQDGIVSLQNPWKYRDNPIQLTEDEFNESMRVVSWKD